MTIKERLAQEDSDDIRSFPGSEPPGPEIGRVVHNEDVFIYYEDELGHIFYATERGLEFARRMEELILANQRRQKNRS